MLCQEKTAKIKEKSQISTTFPLISFLFFGQNSFYTTAANRMSRHIFSMAVTAEDVTALIAANREADLS